MRDSVCDCERQPKCTSTNACSARLRCSCAGERSKKKKEGEKKNVNFDEKPFPKFSRQTGTGAPLSPRLARHCFVVRFGTWRRTFYSRIAKERKKKAKLWSCLSPSPSSFPQSPSKRAVKKKKSRQCGMLESFTLGIVAIFQPFFPPLFNRGVEPRSLSQMSRRNRKTFCRPKRIPHTVTHSSHPLTYIHAHAQTHPPLSLFPIPVVQTFQCFYFFFFFLWCPRLES